ncbi:MAG TPA: hypothetical protein VEI49_01065 [Terriglobales bacterium]|nr:hypothetical protein [Terriglobales bacterium]
MRPDQRETVLVCIDVLERDLPTAHAVAEIALCAISPSMNVGVTVLAVAANVGEHRMNVAFLATHNRMQAAQGITCLAVIEVGFRADRFPG